MVGSEARAPDSRGGVVARFRAGLGLLPRGLGMLRARGELRRLAIVPALVTAAFVAAATAGVVAASGGLLGAIAAELPTLSPGAWYTWLWVGPGQLALWLARYLLFGALAAAALVAALVLATLVSSPVLDALSQRVERIATGAAVGDEEATSALRLAGDAFASLANEARRVAFFLGVWLAISAVGLVVPLGPVLAPVALAAFGVAFLPLEYAGFALDRRRLGFAARRAWLRAHRAESLGFGVAAFAVGCVPGLNFALLPVLVAAGTLFVLEHPPPPRLAGAARPGGAGR